MLASDAAAALPEPLSLFPLRAVLFPGGLLPLKVFEARYLDLVTTSLRERIPFGVVCLQQGSEVQQQSDTVQFETVGVLAHVEQIDSDEAGILRVSCTGGRRFRILSTPAQQSDGLWTCRAEVLAADAPCVPEPPMFGTVEALSRAIAALRAQGSLPFAEPFHLDDAGWVANRWCELLPVSLAAKQRLMQLDDPATRLSIVDSYLRGKHVVT